MNDLTEQEITEAIVEKALGLKKYDSIMETFKEKKIDEDVEGFQTDFDAFYKIRNDVTWRAKYFKFMEENKGNNNLSFEKVINAISDERVEASFASKLLATIKPEQPIWDQYVLKFFGENPQLKSKDKDDRIEEAIEKYKILEEKFNEFKDSSDGKLCIDTFDKLAPHYTHINKTKKIDFILWCMRDE